MSQTVSNENTKFAKCDRKYITPNRRKQQRGNVQKNKSLRRDNKTLKQDIDITNTNDFPELGASTRKNNQCKLNFANAAKEDDKEVMESDVPIGWVKICRNNQKWKIEKTYGTPDPETQHTQYEKIQADVNTNDEQEEPLEKGLDTIQQIKLKQLVEHWQSERDMINEHLGQMSPYWGLKNLNDPLSDDDYETEHSETESDQDEYMCDSDY